MKEKYYYVATFLSYNKFCEKLQGTDLYMSNLGNMYYKEYDEDIILCMIDKKNNIFNLLKYGSIIQITNDNYEYNTIIGNITFEGPHLEKEVFDVIDEEVSFSIDDSLMAINNRVLEDKKIKRKLHKGLKGGIYE